MIDRKRRVVTLAALVLAACAGQAGAQTIGFAEAIGRLANSCGPAIDKFCKNADLGGGEIGQCLGQNQARVSPGCKATVANLAALLKKRAAARAAVMQVCDRDIGRLCAGIQPGDANLMECFDKTRRNVSPACQQTIADAGFDVSLAAGPATNQIHLSSNDIVSSLQGVEASSSALSATSLQQLVTQGIRDPSRANRINRAPLSEELANHAQLTVAIQFDFDSARIRPDSFRAVGLMADALYSPHLQGYCFLIVGNTDAKGSREYNLKLSQQRADAIRDALINPFGISPARVETVGLGEEQLLNRSNPEAAENRRVQLLNIGRLAANAQCAN